MVSFFKTFAVSALASVAVAKDVACAVGGVQQSIVDLDTGVCEFQIPANLPTVWEFTSVEDYSAQFYYTVVNNARVFTDVINAGRVLSIAARDLYLIGEFILFEIESHKSSPGNSTAALRKRFSSLDSIEKRDEESDLVAYLKTLDGTALPGSVALAVVDPAGSSSTSGSGSGSGATSTATSTGTEVITITSCSDDVCVPTTIPAPTVTVESTTIITITSCSENKCSKTEVPATKGPITTTVNGEVTSYTTWCPLSEEEKTKWVTVTSCEEDKCHHTVAPATHGWTTTEVGGETTSYVTWCPVTETKTVPSTVAPATVAPTTKAPATTAPGKATPSTVAGESTSYPTTAASVSTFEASGSLVGASLLSVLLMPLMAFL